MIDSCGTVHYREVPGKWKNKLQKCYTCVVCVAELMTGNISCCSKPDVIYWVISYLQSSPIQWFALATGVNCS